MEELNQSANNAEQQTNHVRVLLKVLHQRRKVFYWLLPITFVIALALNMCVPKYYSCTVKLAPETHIPESYGVLQSLASSLGFNLQSMLGEGTFAPKFYPDIVASPNFLITLVDVPVATSDGTFEGTYSQYLLEHKKVAPWVLWKQKVQSLLSSLRPAAPAVNTPAAATADSHSVLGMNSRQREAVETMQGDIKCKLDGRNDIITISVTAQDKLVCAIMADSVCAALQNFITEYRTAKTRTDLCYYESVMQEAYKEYQQACEQYIRYVDSHKGMSSEQSRIEATNLETEMQLKHSAYTSFQKQYIATQARLQENTPVCTVLQSASIPTSPAGPRRMPFVLGMLIVVTFIASCIVCRKVLFDIAL